MLAITAHAGPEWWLFDPRTKIQSKALILIAPTVCFSGRRLAPEAMPQCSQCRARALRATPTLSLFLSSATYLVSESRAIWHAMASGPPSGTFRLVDRTEITRQTHCTAP